MACPTGYFAQPDNKCGVCIANCDACSDSITCDTCKTNYMLIDGPRTCMSGTSCSIGYYFSITSSSCKLCRPECTACSS